MANENWLGKTPWTVEATTGLRQYRGVAISTAGLAAHPGGSTEGIVGVTYNVTESTVSGYTTVASLYSVGMIAKMEATSSTLSVGDLVSCSTAGEALFSAAGDFTIGIVTSGSSGGANRVLSVMLTMQGST